MKTNIRAFLRKNRYRNMMINPVPKPKYKINYDILIYFINKKAVKRYKIVEHYIPENDRVEYFWFRYGKEFKIWNTLQVRGGLASENIYWKKVKSSNDF